ncbi:MAG TPA: MFS transporter, partial [Phototrophicaceae bacterium]|nr:MFS transporter [Phototrophicaceae bacterium]
MQAEIQKNVRYNFIINQVEGSLFGLGLGFSSYVAVVPLFVASFTHSSVLIGLIAAMRMIGWQLPQLLTANRVAQLKRYKPMSLLMTLNERIPFYVLALIALFSASLGNNLTLILTFIFVTWQSMGGGLTGTAWQSMIAKLIPPGLRGTFYGLQSALANLMQSGSTVLAGIILVHFAAPQSFALCFLLAGVSVTVGWFFLAANREPETPPIHEKARTAREFWGGLRDILRRDTNFRLFIFVRIVAQVAAIGLASFTIYAVRRFEMDAGMAGIMGGVLMLGQVVA